MNWKSKKGKSAMVQMLMKDHGISKREAEKAVNAMFYCMTRALLRGDVVELPIGKIAVGRPPAKKKKRQIKKFCNIQTRKTFHTLVRYPDWTIRFFPNKDLILEEPAPQPSPRTTGKAEEIDQLLTSFGITNITPPEWNRLFAAADRNVDWLLARLQSVARDYPDLRDFGLICDLIQRRYWIR